MRRARNVFQIEDVQPNQVQVSTDQASLIFKNRKFSRERIAIFEKRRGEKFDHYYAKENKSCGHRDLIKKKYDDFKFSYRRCKCELSTTPNLVHSYRSLALVDISFEGNNIQHNQKLYIRKKGGVFSKKLKKHFDIYYSKEKLYCGCLSSIKVELSNPRRYYISKCSHVQTVGIKPLQFPRNNPILPMRNRLSNPSNFSFRLSENDFYIDRIEPYEILETCSLGKVFLLMSRTVFEEEVKNVNSIVCYITLIDQHNSYCIPKVLLKYYSPESQILEISFNIEKNSTIRGPINCMISISCFHKFYETQKRLVFYFSRVLSSGILKTGSVCKKRKLEDLEAISKNKLKPGELFGVYKSYGCLEGGDGVEVFFSVCFFNKLKFRDASYLFPSLNCYFGSKKANVSPRVLVREEFAHRLDWLKKYDNQKFLSLINCEFSIHVVSPRSERIGKVDISLVIGEETLVLRNGYEYKSTNNQTMSSFLQYRNIVGKDDSIQDSRF